MKKRTTKELTLVAMIVALMSATSLVSIPLPALPPITLQTLFVFLAGLLLRKEDAFLAMVVYIIIGLLGLPVFSNGTSGLAALLGSTGGFIMAFPLAAYATAFIKNRKFLNKDSIDLFVNLFIINLIIYMIGGAYFMYITKATLSATILIFWVYIPGDIIKIIAAIYVSINIRKYFSYEHS